jgi:hypothetical protein
VTATDELRTTCAEVARRARSVRVQEDAIQAYAASLVGGRDISAPPVRLSGASRADQAAYWLTLDAINFGSGWFPTLRKDGVRRLAGALGLRGATRCRGAHPPHPR